MSLDLGRLYRARKTLVGPAKWVDVGSTQLRLNAALSVDGEVIEGLELRGGCQQTVPDRAVRLQIQHHPSSGPCTPLGRAEWRPFSPHTNPKSAPGDLAFARIGGSHLHSFDLNWLEDAGRMRSGNLPVACPIGEPPSFEDFLSRVGKEFNITGIERIAPPPWRLGDLFGI